MEKKELFSLGSVLWIKLEAVMRWTAYRLFRLNISQKLWNRFMQFVKFGLVGLSNTAVSYMTFLISLFLGLHYILANILGFVVSILNSFFWNSKVVFKNQGTQSVSPFKTFLKSSTTYLFTGLALSNVLLYLEVNFLSWSKVVAPLVNLIVTIPLNFILNKVWAFRDTT